MKKYRKIKDLKRDDKKIEYVGVMSLFDIYKEITHTDISKHSQYFYLSKGTENFFKMVLDDLEAKGYIEEIRNV